LLCFQSFYLRIMSLLCCFAFQTDSEVNLVLSLFILEFSESMINMMLIIIAPWPII
jgi:hypothetical protein